MSKRMDWFKFFPKDFMDDEEVKLMTLDAVGLYMKMLCHCWTHGSIPCDENDIRIIFNLSKHKYKKLFPQIFSKFFKKNERFFNKRIDFEKQSAENIFRQNSENGSKGGKSLWNGSSVRLSSRQSEAKTLKSKSKNKSKNKSNPLTPFEEKSSQNDVSATLEEIEDPWISIYENESLENAGKIIECVNFWKNHIKKTDYQAISYIQNLFGEGVTYEDLMNAMKNLKNIYDSEGRIELYRANFNNAIPDVKAVTQLLVTGSKSSLDDDSIFGEKGKEQWQKD